MTAMGDGRIGILALARTHQPPRWRREIIDLKFLEEEGKKYIYIEMSIERESYCYFFLFFSPKGDLTLLSPTLRPAALARHQANISPSEEGRKKKNNTNVFVDFLKKNNRIGIKSKKFLNKKNLLLERLLLDALGLMDWYMTCYLQFLFFVAVKVPISKLLREIAKEKNRDFFFSSKPSTNGRRRSKREWNRVGTALPNRLNRRI